MSSRLLYLKDVTTLSVDESRCTGCRRCTEVCPHAVLRVEDSRVRIVEPDACMECGACARNCEEGAIDVRPGVGCAAAVIASRFRGGVACGDGPCCGS